MAAKKEVLIEVREKALRALASLPPKMPEKELLDDSLKALKPTIETLLERGYTREEVVAQLVKQGIPAKLFHIKNLLANKRATAAEPETSGPEAAPAGE